MTESHPGFDPTQPLPEMDAMRANMAYYQMLSTHMGITAVEQSHLLTVQDEHIHHLDAQINHLEEQTMTDPLLEISNRRKLDRTYEALTQQHPMRRHNETTPASESDHAVIMIDVDRFGDFNNTYGHAAGDAVLKAVALAGRNSVRGRDEFGRYGGEEMCVLLPRTTVEEAALVAEKMRTAIEGLRVSHDDQTLNVTASFGVAKLEHAADLAAGVRNADTAIYAAKDAGRNNVQVYDPSMDQHRP